jgi:hypothetical protein
VHPLQLKLIELPLNVDSYHQIGASAARPLATIENTIVARGFAAEAPKCYFQKNFGLFWVSEYEYFASMKLVV